MRLKLREWMEIRRVSQAQIAAALGVTRATVSAWAEGKMRAGKRVRVFPDPDYFGALCAFFECTPGDLLDVESRATPTGKTWRDFTALVVA